MPDRHRPAVRPGEVAFLLLLFAAFPVYIGDGSVGGGIGITVFHGRYLLIIDEGCFFPLAEWRNPKKGKKSLAELLSFGGRNRTRTCDPIDVNDVLSPCGRFVRFCTPLNQRRTVGITAFSAFSFDLIILDLY